MSTQTQELKDQLRRFRMAMLTTVGAQGELRARPMVLARVDDDGTLWFVTSRDSGKTDELVHDSRVSVICQSATRQVAVYGHAELVDSQEQVDAMWDAKWDVFIPEHERQAARALIKVKAESAEFWHVSTESAARFAVDAVKSLVRGEAPHGRPDRYGHVDL